jgi:hypothetical protein
MGRNLGIKRSGTVNAFVDGALYIKQAPFAIGNMKIVRMVIQHEDIIRDVRWCRKANS